MKLRTVEDFLDKTNWEYTWRLQEIHDLRQTIKTSSYKKTLLRASVPLLYAHWEGFVKKSTECLIAYIDGRKLHYNDLSLHYVAYGGRKVIDGVLSSPGSFDSLMLVDFFLNKQNEIAKLSFKGLVKTDSNLRSLVLEKILKSINVNTQKYSTKYMLIDKRLVDARNSIAHGEPLMIDESGFLDLSVEVLDLMQLYKNDIQNIVAQKTYLRTKSH